MTKTRKQRSGKRFTKKVIGGADANMDNCQYPATFHGLHEWHNAMFEKLGWMVLAKEKHMDDKITSYKNGLNRLKEKLQCKWNSTEEQDRKDDLKILADNVEILIAHVARDFP